METLSKKLVKGTRFESVIDGERGAWSYILLEDVEVTLVKKNKVTNTYEFNHDALVHDMSGFSRSEVYSAGDRCKVRIDNNDLYEVKISENFIKVSDTEGVLKSNTKLYIPYDQGLNTELIKLKEDTKVTIEGNRFKLVSPTEVKAYRHCSSNTFNLELSEGTLLKLIDSDSFNVEYIKLNS